MADLSFILDRALALAAITAPSILLVALLCIVAARSWVDPATSRREDDSLPRWPVGK